MLNHKGWPIVKFDLCTFNSKSKIRSLNNGFKNQFKTKVRRFES